MAVSCHVAFGHYLRTLRERRGLALEDVWTLSQTFPESLNKGYLSRCENGKQKLALPKVVAMSRIYEVPADVFLERLELDLELEKIGGPPTEKLNWSQLREAGKNALQHGHKWEGYAFLRDATFHAAKADLDASAYANPREQEVAAFINVASAAQGLGKYRYARHEYLYAENTSALGPNSSVLAATRLASVFASLEDHDTAQEYADLALARLSKAPNCPFEGFVYELQGLHRLRRKNQIEAIPWFQKAYDSFRNLKLVRNSANTLIGLADCYLELRNYGAATRTLETALHLCDQYSLVRIRALALTIQGIIDQASNRPESAEEKLREAKELAKGFNDRILRFQVDFYLYKQAQALDHSAAARAIRRRLKKLMFSIPGTVEQVVEFKMLEKSLPARD